MPVYKTNTSADNASTAKDETFLAVKQGNSVRARILPAMNKDGRTIFRQDLHHNLKDPASDDGDRGIAVGCTNYHGDLGEGCLICDVGAVFAASTDPNEVKMTKYPDSILKRKQFCVPALEAIPDGDGGRTYGPPKLLKLSPTGADALSALNSMMESEDITMVNDVDGGQDVVISNPPTAGAYTIQQTSKQVPLYDVAPESVTESFPDVMKVLATKIYSREKQEAVLRHSFKGVDWDAVMAEVNK
jgi:hypothetical protein